MAGKIAGGGTGVYDQRGAGVAIGGAFHARGFRRGLGVQFIADVQRCDPAASARRRSPGKAHVPRWKR